MEMPPLKMVLFGAKLLVWKIDIFMCLMFRLASPICMQFVRFMMEHLKVCSGDQIPIVLSRFLSRNFHDRTFQSCAIVCKFNLGL